MKDRSVGIIVFREPRKYLVLLKKRSSDFAKGHPEKGETDEQAARRELFEETGIGEVELLPGFKEDIRYRFGKKKRVDKTISFFLGRTKESRVRISKEHQGYRWCSPAEAKRLIKYPEQQALIEKAEVHLQQARM